MLNSSVFIFSYFYQMKTCGKAVEHYAFAIGLAARHCGGVWVVDGALCMARWLRVVVVVVVVVVVKEGGGGPEVATNMTKTCQPAAPRSDERTPLFMNECKPRVYKPLRCCSGWPHTAYEQPLK